MRLVHLVLGALVSSTVYATPTPGAEPEAAAAAPQPQKKCTTNTECIRMRELAARSKDLEDREAEAEALAAPELDLEERGNDLRPRQSRRAVVEPRQSRRAVVEPRQSRRAVVEPRQSRRALVEPRQSRRAIVPRQSRRAQPAKREIVEVPTHKKLTGHIMVYSAGDLSTPLGVVVSNPNAAGRITMQGQDQVRNAGRMTVTFDAKIEDVTADITLRVEDAPLVLTAERGAMNQSPVDQLSSGNWNYAFLTCGNSELSKDENQSTFVAETPRKTESALWTFNPTDSTLVPSWVNPDGTSTVASIVFAGESADVSDADRAIMLTGDVSAFDDHFAEKSKPLVFKLAIH